MILGVPADIYLDANATTRVLPQAAEDAKAAMEELFGNPSSSHITGIRARQILERTRSLVRSVLGAERGQIIFTSGATEAIQIGVFSTLIQVREQRAQTSANGRLLLYGATEHKAVPQALSHWNRTLDIGDRVLEIPVDRTGMLDLGFLREHAASADMICTMAVNNETGVVHDLMEIEHTVRTCNEQVCWMVDCVQAVGKLRLNLSATTVDYAPISGHKIHAPKGIGVLYVSENAHLTPLFAGGGQESGARSGTENLPGVAALAAVLRCLDDETDLTFKDLPTLVSYRDQIVESLKKALPSIVFNTPLDKAVPTTINFSVKGLSSKEVMDLFDAAGIRVSSGSACGSALRGSYVLDAMGLPRWRSEGAIRVSFGLTSEVDQISAACRRIEETGKALREACLIAADEPATAPESPIDGLIQLKYGSMCSWVLIDSSTSRCIVIDPCEELSDRIENIIRCQRCDVLAVVDTHLHVDHDSCREKLLSSLDDLCNRSSRSTDPLGWPDSSSGTAVLGDGRQAEYFCFTSDMVFARTELPGHTTDGWAYFVGKLKDDNCLKPQDIRFAFTGDTLLIGGVGRTDFPSSSPKALYESLQRLPCIVADSTLICPTHDYTHGWSTTLETERRLNKFLARILDPVMKMPLEQFLHEKRVMDSEIDNENSEELICGLICSHTNENSSIDIAPDQCKDFLQAIEIHESSMSVSHMSSNFTKTGVSWDWINHLRMFPSQDLAISYNACWLQMNRLRIVTSYSSVVAETAVARQQTRSDESASRIPGI